ncbi:hypothetical protein DENSPDRAFT_855473 [Dentipellis sp. KUC8613]|nr:hypothetical protein DENSPDRAFT_855473 [Dentipellis sp. KUC8613]
MRTRLRNEQGRYKVQEGANDGRHLEAADGVQRTHGGGGWRGKGDEGVRRRWTARGDSGGCGDSANGPMRARMACGGHGEATSWRIRRLEGGAGRQRANEGGAGRRRTRGQHVRPEQGTYGMLMARKGGRWAHTAPEGRRRACGGRCRAAECVAGRRRARGQHVWPEQGAYGVLTAPKGKRRAHTAPGGHRQAAGAYGAWRASVGAWRAAEGERGRGGRREGRIGRVGRVEGVGYGTYREPARACSVFHELDVDFVKDFIQNVGRRSMGLSTLLLRCLARALREEALPLRSVSTPYAPFSGHTCCPRTLGHPPSPLATLHHPRLPSAALVRHPPPSATLRRPAHALGRPPRAFCALGRPPHARCRPPRNLRCLHAPSAISMHPLRPSRASATSTRRQPPACILCMPSAASTPSPPCNALHVPAGTLQALYAPDWASIRAYRK